MLRKILAVHIYMYALGLKIIYLLFSWIKATSKSWCQPQKNFYFQILWGKYPISVETRGLLKYLTEQDLMGERKDDSSLLW